MICSKCGHQLKEQAKFCVNCGESIPTDILWKKTLKIAGCVGIAAGCYYLFNATRWGIAFPHSILLVQDIFFIFVSVMFVINGAKYEKMKTLMIYSIVLLSLVLMLAPMLYMNMWFMVSYSLPWLFLYASLMTKNKWLKIAGIACVLVLLAIPFYEYRDHYREYIYHFGWFRFIWFHIIVNYLPGNIVYVLPIIFLVGTRKIIRYMKNGETQMAQ